MVSFNRLVKNIVLPVAEPADFFAILSPCLIVAPIAVELPQQVFGLSLFHGVLQVLESEVREPTIKSLAISDQQKSTHIRADSGATLTNQL